MLKIVLYLSYYLKTTRHIMGRLQAYPIKIRADKLQYRFISKGAEGDIVKIVAYDFWENNKWNLAFGDANADESDFDDKVISNNQDMRRVIQTIFATGLIFSDAYPDRRIYIEPVDRKRKLLYNRVFQDQQVAIEEFYTIHGLFILEDKEEKYDAHTLYDAFLLTKK
jgi:hypothetical protein